MKTQHPIEMPNEKNQSLSIIQCSSISLRSLLASQSAREPRHTDPVNFTGELQFPCEVDRVNVL
jgi:hypothetical protein